MDPRGFWTSRRIAHAVFTLALALPALYIGVTGFVGDSDFSTMVVSLGYPAYVPPLLGLFHLLGAFALLQAKRPKLREWAYAGFAVSFVGATWSQLNAGPILDSLPPVLMVAFLIISYSTRGSGAGSL